MDPPPGFTPKEGKVCRIKKALYRLKQSPRAWFGRLSLAMKGFGYKQATTYHTTLREMVMILICLLFMLMT